MIPIRRSRLVHPCSKAALCNLMIAEVESRTHDVVAFVAAATISLASSEQHVTYFNVITVAVGMSSREDRSKDGCSSQHATKHRKIVP